MGQHLVHALSQSLPEAKLVVVDLKPSPFPVHDLSALTGVELHVGVDILDSAAMSPLMAGVDQVIHLAGIVSFSLKARKQLEAVNVGGAEAVARAALEARVRQVVQVSSVAALGYNDDAANPIDETHDFDWREAYRRRKYYMISKHRADEVMGAYRRRGLPVVTVYPGLIMGPGDHCNTVKMLRPIMQGKASFALPGGTNIVDVRDVTRGIVELVTRGFTSGSYLLSGHNMSSMEIIRTIVGQAGGKVPRRTLPRFMRWPLYQLALLGERLAPHLTGITADNVDSSFKYRYFSHDLATRTFGWHPEISFAQSVSDTVAWLRQHELL